MNIIMLGMFPNPDTFEEAEERYMDYVEHEAEREMDMLYLGEPLCPDIDLRLIFECECL